MSLQSVIKVQLDRFNGEEIGIIASVVYQRFDNNINDFVWVVDVDLETASSNPNAAGLNTLIGVPIQDPSRAAFSADIGTQITLSRRPNDNRYVVTGLAKFAPGTTSVCLVTLSGCNDGISSIGNPVVFGSVIRLLTYDELGDPLLNGGFVYGDLPYGTAGKFDISGSLIKLLIA
jgi:hypothetical protein